MEGGIGKLGDFLRQNSLKSIFKSLRSDDEDIQNAPTQIPQLSHIANSVVARCSRILLLPTEELQRRFETELPYHVKPPSNYARNLLEYCSYQALQALSQRSDYLSDKKFRRLTYDMMLAWEAPGMGSESLHKETDSPNRREIEAEDGGSLFYSNSMSMAVQVDKKTVGPEAFARIAPACPTIADVITVHNLFDALTSSSGGQLHFLIYDKYLGSLNKVLKTAKRISWAPLPSNLQLAEGEIILDVDGTVPTQPVLQHVGISAWPGRLTLTNRALYFESLGVGSYNKAVAYNLSIDLKQVVKPESTGPLGFRIFDTAVMYNSTSIEEAVYLEFAEFKGHLRRDYWLEIIHEVLHVHKFIRKFNLKEIQQAESLSKATLGIFRYRAVREAFHIAPSHFKTLLMFNLAESLPGGDVILETLSSRLELLNTGFQREDAVGTTSEANFQSRMSPVSLLSLTRLGFMPLKDADVSEESNFLVGDVHVGETNPLEMAVKLLEFDSGQAEAAQETVAQVKVEGIETNLAVMKELLFPVVESVRRFHYLASWEDPFKSTIFLVLICYSICRGWINLIFPCIFIFLAALMLWHKYHSKGKPLEPFKVISPPALKPVEQLLALQEIISQFETLVQHGNIILLKLRALLFATLPQATEKVAVLLIIAGAVFAYVPLKYLIMLVFIEKFTREMPLRKESSDKLMRRVREWWVRVPAAPVQLVKPDGNKKRK